MHVLSIDQLSYWERKTYFENIDFLIIGAGIVGYSAAIELATNYPKSKIVILERSYLPSGASTKNAGFACFGSPSELMDDLQKIDESVVWETVTNRWEGLQNLKSLVGPDCMELENHGSWDLIMSDDALNEKQLSDNLPYLNDQLVKITGEKNVFQEDASCVAHFGFKSIKTAFYNRLEGQINTGKLMTRLHQIAIQKGIHCVFGISVEALQLNLYNVGLQTSVGYLKSSNVLICTNGFARQFLPKKDILPARAQVLVTSPIDELKIKGTFHYQQGYYYFRNVDDRILIGGGRNLDIEGETTTILSTTESITTELKRLLTDVILSEKHFSIDYEWAGIMGVGATKQPIIEKIDAKIGVGVRMGGMGVAIGTSVGKRLANLF
jgi:gamma-glutamylputrescine oxidase